MQDAEFKRWLDDNGIQLPKPSSGPTPLMDASGPSLYADGPDLDKEITPDEQIPSDPAAEMDPAEAPHPTTVPNDPALAPFFQRATGQGCAKLRPDGSPCPNPGTMIPILQVRPPRRYGQGCLEMRMHLPTCRHCASRIRVADLVNDEGWASIVETVKALNLVEPDRSRTTIRWEKLLPGMG